MTKKEINNILKNESGIILIEKKSEQSFFETFFSNIISIVSILYFLKREKNDSLLLTENRIILIIRNKIYTEKKLIEFKSMNYNGNKSTIEVIDQNKSFTFPLNKLRVTYKESKLIRKKLTEFINRKKTFIAKELKH